MQGCPHAWMYGYVHHRFWWLVVYLNLKLVWDNCRVIFHFVSLLFLFLNSTWLFYWHSFCLTCICPTSACLCLLPICITSLDLNSQPRLCTPMSVLCQPLLISDLDPTCDLVPSWSEWTRGTLIAALLLTWHQFSQVQVHGCSFMAPKPYYCSNSPCLKLQRCLDKNCERNHPHHPKACYIGTWQLASSYRSCVPKKPLLTRFVTDMDCMRKAHRR